MGKPSPEFIAELDVLTYLADDSIVLTLKFMLVVQNAPQQHCDDGDQCGDDDGE